MLIITSAEYVEPNAISPSSFLTIVTIPLFGASKDVLETSSKADLKAALAEKTSLSADSYDALVLSNA